MTNPTRVADGMSSHVNYTVNTNTTNEKYSYSQSVVVRRYNDFLWLHDILTDEYPYAVIPPMPEKNTMNRFEIEFVETRRASLQSFLREIAADPLLKESKRLRTFLTADDEKFAEEKAETKSSLKDSLKGNPMEAGMKLLKLMGNGLNKVGTQVQKSVQQQMGGEAPMSKEDEKFAKYVQYINDLSEQVAALAARASDFVDHQSDFTMNLIDVGLAMNLMGQLQQDVVGDAMRSLNDAINVIQQIWTEIESQIASLIPSIDTLEGLKAIAQMIVQTKNSKFIAKTISNCLENIRSSNPSTRSIILTGHIYQSLHCVLYKEIISIAQECDYQQIVDHLSTRLQSENDSFKAQCIQTCFQCLLHNPNKINTFLLDSLSEVRSINSMNCR